MAFGFGNDDHQEPLAEINVTPFVDVMLVLFVIFLVTAPMLTQAVKLELPAETATTLEDENPITISVDAKGQYYWNDAPITSEGLTQHLQTANPAQPIHLRADKQTPYEKVSHILAAAQAQGLTNIGFITQPK